jgi:hypothetical protein
LSPVTSSNDPTNRLATVSPFGSCTSTVWSNVHATNVESAVFQKHPANADGHGAVCTHLQAFVPSPKGSVSAAHPQPELATPADERNGRIDGVVGQ